MLLVHRGIRIIRVEPPTSSLQGVHEDVHVGGGHLVAHCHSLYLLVDMCVEREKIALEN